VIALLTHPVLFMAVIKLPSLSSSSNWLDYLNDRSCVSIAYSKTEHQTVSALAMQCKQLCTKCHPHCFLGLHQTCNQTFLILSGTSCKKIGLHGCINPLNPELNPICYLLALLGAHHFLHVSRIRVKLLTFRLLMSYTYGAPILDVSRSHTTTQHSR